MASSPQTTPSPLAAGDDRNLVTVDENYLAPTFEDRVQLFWEKHGRLVIAALVLVALGFAAQYLFGLYAARREAQVRAAYAAAADSAALRAFAEAHPGTALAGVAHLRLADEASARDDHPAAAAAYAAAAPLLADNPLATRARLGEAMSLALAGDAAAPAALERLANDTTLAAPARAESAYHLAILARDSGRAEDLARWAALALSVDTSGVWAERAGRLRARTPVATPTAESAPAPATTPASSAAPATPAAADAPTVSFPGATAP